MSSNLAWVPSISPDYNYLNTSIKLALRKKYDGDVETTMDSSDINYLRGLLDAGIDDAKELIEAIEKYGTITVSEIWT